MYHLQNSMAASAQSRLADRSPEKHMSRNLMVGSTLPYLTASGGELLFYGRGGHFLIGPVNERWDAAMLVRQSSVASFLEFASNPGYLAGIGHRTAALEDSRLLPLMDAQA
jgi:hypothetical protein